MTQESRLRPLYARLLGLRHLNPGGLLCFLFLEGTVAFGLLLALAELIAWWGILVLPVMVAVMVKANDLVAGAVVRSAALVPEQERDRFRREVLSGAGWVAVSGLAADVAGPGVPANAGVAGPAVMATGVCRTSRRRTCPRFRAGAVAARRLR